MQFEFAICSPKDIVWRTHPQSPIPVSSSSTEMSGDDDDADSDSDADDADADYVDYDYYGDDDEEVPNMWNLFLWEFASLTIWTIDGGVVFHLILVYRSCQLNWYFSIEGILRWIQTESNQAIAGFVHLPIVCAVALNQ